MRRDRLIGLARAAIGDGVAFDLAWWVGRSWSIDEALRYAIGQ